MTDSSESFENLERRLLHMHALAADSCDPQYNRALLEAADAIATLRRERDEARAQIMPIEDVNNLDEVVRELGIDSSFITPAEAVRSLIHRAECAEADLQAAKDAGREEAAMRAALERIISEAESDDGLSAWDGADIAREALGADAPPPASGQAGGEFEARLRAIHSALDSALGDSDTTHIEDDDNLREASDWRMNKCR